MEVTLKARIARDNVRAEATMTDKPEWSDWEDAYWYSVTLRRKRRQMTTPFGTGYGWDREPDAEDVLESLLSDASGIENARSFEDWADEYGYDTDSRKALATYELTRDQTAKLRRFLGDDYQSYLWETER